MKRSKLFVFVLVAVIFAATAIPTSAEITVNDSYMFLLGDKYPENTDPYKTPAVLSEEEARAYLSSDVSYGNLSALLRAGSALDLLGYMKKYGVSESRAYDLTQKALNILVGTASHTQEIQGLTSSEKQYLAAVLKAGYDKTPVPTAITVTGLSPELKRDAEGFYVSEVMNYVSVMGGILRFTDVPDGVKLYTLSGDEAPYLLSGQSFYFKSDRPFSLSTLTAEHIYNIPEIIVSYHENSAYSPLVTAIISPEDTAKDTLAVSFIRNPDTGDGNAAVKAYTVTAFLSLAILAVERHHGRKKIKIGAVGR